jgi:hypothetical protein
MDPTFLRLVTQYTPQPNPLIMEGLACTYMPRTEEYINAVMVSASRSFPPGLTYVGYERCTPREEYEETTRPENNKRFYDLARSDLYLVKYYLNWGTEALKPRYLYLPFTGRGGIIHLGGGMYHISPVLTDKVISPSQNSVFVRLLRDKINFERQYHTFLANRTQETIHVAWANIYRTSKERIKVPATTKAYTTAFHYLLGKFGFAETFRRYVGQVPVIGGKEITHEAYPPDQWMVCESTGMKPKTSLDSFYQPTEIRLAIPLKDWTVTMKTFVGAFYYVVDHFPDKIRPEYIGSQDEVYLWKILLGHIIFSGHYGAGKLYEGVEEHYASLNEYLDDLIAIKLQEAGYYVDVFYDLLALIITHFNDWVVGASENSASLYHKTLEVLYYALFDITSAIYRTNFKLNKLATKKPLTLKDVEKMFNQHLKMGLAYRLTNENIAVSTVSDSGDHLYSKITSVVAQQQNVAGAKRRGKGRMAADASKRHTSLGEVGSLLFLSKGSATPAARANMFLQFDPATGNIVPKEKFNDLRAATDALLARPLERDDDLPEEEVPSDIKTE